MKRLTISLIFVIAAVLAIGAVPVAAAPPDHAGNPNFGYGPNDLSVCSCPCNLPVQPIEGPPPTFSRACSSTNLVVGNWNGHSMACWALVKTDLPRPGGCVAVFPGKGAAEKPSKNPHH